MTGMICLGLCFAAVGLGGPPWTKPAGRWTKPDAIRILTRSPWAKSVVVHDASGAQRLIVRWEDALPIRQALGKIGVEPAAASGASYYAVAVVLPRAADEVHDWTKARAS